MRTVWDGPMVAIPHPASRVLTNALLEHCSRMLGWWTLLREHPTMNSIPPEFELTRDTRNLRIALRQERGTVVVETL